MRYLRLVGLIVTAVLAVGGIGMAATPATNLAAHKVTVQIKGLSASVLCDGLGVIHTAAERTSALALHDELWSGQELRWWRWYEIPYRRGGP